MSRDEIRDDIKDDDIKDGCRLDPKEDLIDNLKTNVTDQVPLLKEDSDQIKSNQAMV